MKRKRVVMKMNFLSFVFLEAPPDPSSPFTKIQTFLNDKVISGLLGIATPIATLAFIGLGIAAMLATDEHARAKLKSGMWWVGAAAAICFMAQSIVNWLKGAF